MSYSSCYLINVVNPKNGRKVVKSFIDYIRKSKVKFDTVACRGTSGLLVAPTVTQRMRKELIVVRKEDGNHSGSAMEGYTEAKNYIIVDDMIATGRTLETIIKVIHNQNPGAKCVGIFLYRSYGSTSFKYPPTGQIIPCWNMYHKNDKYTDFDFNPDLLKKDKPAATELQKFCHKANAVPVQGTLAIS